MTIVKNFLGMAVWLTFFHARKFRWIILFMLVLIAFIQIDNFNVFENMSTVIVRGVVSITIFVSIFLIFGLGNAIFYIFISPGLRKEMAVRTFVSHDAAHKYFVSGGRLR